MDYGQCPNSIWQSFLLDLGYGILPQLGLLINLAATDLLVVEVGWNSVYKLWNIWTRWTAQSQ